MASHDPEKYSSNNSNSDKNEDHYVTTTTADEPSEFYDPSKESIWTRLGVNFESFKPAPGTTGYVSHLIVAAPRPRPRLLSARVALRSSVLTSLPL